MHPADPHFVVGYDPGGNGRHGLAVLQVQHQQGLWVASRIVALRALPDVQAVIACAEACISQGALVATGIDTLTAWSGGPSGWRQADLWLRQRYPTVKNSVASPNSLFGSMSIGSSLQLPVHAVDRSTADAFGSSGFGREPGHRYQVAPYFRLAMSVHFHKKLLTTQCAGVAVVTGRIHCNARLVDQGIHVIFQVGRIEGFLFRFHPPVIIPGF